MRLVPLSHIQARVRLANYHSCGHTQAWMQRKIIDLQFIYVVAGALAYQADQEAIVNVNQGQVLCILPTQRHDLSCSAADTVISGIHCELSAGSWASADYRLDPAPRLVTNCGPEQQIEQQFKLCAELFSGYGSYVQQRCNSVCQDIIFALAEHWIEGNELRMSKRMLEMIAFIRAHLHNELTRQHLAEAFYLTPEHINYIFKQELGMTPSEVINRERCLLAHQLLIDGLSVKEAAYKVGFNDPLFFSRVFKKYFQVPPSKV